VHVVAGSEDNLKITYPRDISIAETLLQDQDGGISS
jgi:2-C-methyl-D-erythritol 4-phosphate cytidylyltransferase